MPFARASELDRLLECPGSAFLPRAPDRPIEAGQWGRMVHRWKATGVVVPEPEFPNHEHLFRERLDLIRPDREALWPGGGHEIAVGLSTATGAAAAFGGPPEDGDAWKAALPDDWISGTLDYRGEILDALWVEDLKTGRNAPEPTIHQLTFYVLVAHRVAWPTPPRALASVFHWPRYPRHVPGTRHWRTVAQTELAAFEERLRRLRLRVLARDPRDLNPGPHCTFCPSRPHCPAANERNES